ncbi:UNVERIFIED_CONTAM: hypothetical protein FKN15_055764 [Acipenser sinensis]
MATQTGAQRKFALFTSRRRASTLQDYYGTLALQDGAREGIAQSGPQKPESPGGQDFGSNSSSSMRTCKVLGGYNGPIETQRHQGPQLPGRSFALSLQHRCLSRLPILGLSDK